MALIEYSWEALQERVLSAPTRQGKSEHNTEKTKILLFGKKQNVIQDDAIEIMAEFLYMGSLTNSVKDCPRYRKRHLQGY